jgi:hypothetical protein
MTLLQIATFALGVPLGLLVVGSALFWAGAGFRSQSNAGPSQDRVEDLLGTERDSDGVPWALLASDRDGRLEFAGPAILNPSSGAQSGLERTDGSIGGCQAAAARVEAGFCSVAEA